MYSTPNRVEGQDINGCTLWEVREVPSAYQDCKATYWLGTGREVWTLVQFRTAAEAMTFLLERHTDTNLISGVWKDNTYKAISVTALIPGRIADLLVEKLNDLAE
jgi:hypothetical protein